MPTHIEGLEPPQRSRGHLETHRRFVCTHVARAVRASIRCHRCVRVLTGAHGISTNVEADSEVLLRANSHRDWIAPDGAARRHDRFRRAAESNRSIRSCCERCAANAVTDVRASDRHWFGAVHVVEPDANGIAGRRHPGDHADRRVRDAVLTQCLLRGAPRSDPSRIRRLSRYRWRGPERCEQHGACGRGQTDSDHP